MESVLKRAILRGEQQQECDVLQAIREVCRQLDSVQARFEMDQVNPMESDSDLIDACIYEMEALRARYRFLLRQAKQEGLTACANTPLWDNKA